MKPYYDDGQITLFCGRAEDVLAWLDPECVDLVLTDPPYFRVKGEWWDRQWNTRDGFLAWIGALADEWQRVLTANGSLYCFASPDMAWFVEGEIRQRFNVLNSIRWRKEAGWHNKAEKEALRSFLSPWEAIIFAEQFGAESFAEQESGYYAALRDAHMSVFGGIGSYIAAERERSGLTRGEVEIALGYTATGDPTRGTALCTRWEEGSSLPTRDAYDRFRTLLTDRTPQGAPYFTRTWDELKAERDRAATAYSGRRPEYAHLRQAYEDLRRPFALSDRDEWSDVWNWKTVDPRYGKHPCEKPRAMMEHIIKASTRPGDVVLDCFAGTGSTLDAARLTGRQAIGVEISERHCESIVARLAQVPLFTTVDVA